MTSIERPLVYKVPKNWNVHTVNEIRSMDAHSCVAGPFGSKISSKFFVDDGVPVIRGSNLRDDLTRFVPENFVFLSETKAQEFRPQLVKGGDLIFTCWGTIGQVGLIPENGPYPEYIISNKQLKLRVNQKIASPLFCFYYFASPLYVEHVRNRNIGGAVPGINLGILKSFRIALPPIKVQDGLIEILGSYDDLIENNRRRMALLEDAARQMYQEWFVRLRFPGCEHARIVDGVPDGWKKGMVSDFYETSSGGTPSRKRPEYFTGEIPWVKTQELHDGFIIDTDEKITEAALKNSSAKLFSDKTILVALYGATIGKIGILAVPATTNQACCAIIPTDKSSHYIHAFLFFRENKERLVSLSAGAAQNNISQQIIRGFEMIVPKPSLMKSFTESLEPVFEQWLILHRQNHKLRTARDLLLPKLMSGELTV